MAARALAKDLKVEALPKTNMIEVTYSSADPQRSYGVLKALGELYLEKQVKSTGPRVLMSSLKENAEVPSSFGHRGRPPQDFPKDGRGGS